jgi:hypothetical protein
MNYKEIIKEMMQPKDKLGSVIECFDTVCEILEARNRMIGKEVDKKDLDVMLVRILFSMHMITFWQAHGGVMRPMILNAMNSTSPVNAFLIDAIPAALTIADVKRHDEYNDIRLKVIELANRL